MVRVLPFILWDCTPLLVAIGPIVVDFIFRKLRYLHLRNLKTGRIEFRTIFLASLLVGIISSTLIFFVTLFILDFKIALGMFIMITSVMLIVFVLYKKMYWRVHLRGEVTMVAFILTCLLIIAVDFGLAIMITKLLKLNLEVFGWIFVIGMIISPLFAFVIFYNKVNRVQDQKELKATTGSFTVFCLVIVSFIISFPVTNIFVGAPAGGWKFRWMERFRGESTETFISVFGQPARIDGHYLFYGKLLWYDYLNLDDLWVRVDNDTISGFVWVD